MSLEEWVYLVIWVAAIPVGLFAFVHALSQPGEAFMAAGKNPKPEWLVNTGCPSVVLVLLPFGSLGTLVWIAALVAALVYIVDVRPAVAAVQRGWPDGFDGRPWGAAD